MTAEETTFPAVPRGSGARTLSVIWFCVAVAGAALLVLMVWISAPLAAHVGLGSFEQATVTSRDDTVGSYPTRGQCRRYTKYAVEWDSGNGTFGTCTTRAQWDVGDPVEVAVAPWSDHVSAESADLGWNVLGWVAAIAAMVHGVRAGRRYHLLTRGGTGTEIRGRVHAIRSTHVSVLPHPDESDPRRIVLLPAVARLRVTDGDRVSIWSSRRGWGDRPRGPWVVKAGRQVSVATHLLRRSAPPPEEPPTPQ